MKKSPIGQDAFWPLTENAMNTGDIKRYVVLKMRQQAFRPELPETASAILGGQKSTKAQVIPRTVWET